MEKTDGTQKTRRLRNVEKATVILNDDEVVVTKKRLRILLEGLCAWNNLAVDLLQDIQREKLYKAQDLIDKMWKESGPWKADDGA